MIQQFVINEWLWARSVSPPTFFSNSMNRQCILRLLRELVCWLTKKVLSARSQVGYNIKHNFELWYNVGIYLADRQKNRRGPAVEKH